MEKKNETPSLNNCKNSTIREDLKSIQSDNIPDLVFQEHWVGT